MLGVYVSVPFCRTKCSYCNFASDVFSKTAYESYVQRVIEDISNARTTAAELGCHLQGAVDSVYLGGGTPSVLNSSQLERVFEAVRKQFPVVPGAEITVECAPGSLTPALIDTLLRCGVNRVSLGVQSFVDQEAAAVGRLHKRTTVLEEMASLRKAGISNINVDLIAGLPHQTAESWKFSLDETIATGAPHVSVYMLEVDEDSRLGRELIAGGTRYHAHFVPDDAAVADFYVRACETLHATGIVQYEISNFARAGFESRHNLKYWTRQPYIGFGVDAHSMLETENGPADAGSNPVRGIRFASADSLDGYLNRGPLVVTAVSDQTAVEESFFLGLRLNRGVEPEGIREEFGTEYLSAFESDIDECVADGLLERQGATIRLTPRGRLLSNEVFARFIDDRKPAKLSPAANSGATVEGPVGTRSA